MYALITCLIIIFLVCYILGRYNKYEYLDAPTSVTIPLPTSLPSLPTSLPSLPTPPVPALPTSQEVQSFANSQMLFSISSLMLSSCCLFFFIMFPFLIFMKRR